MTRFKLKKTFCLYLQGQALPMQRHFTTYSIVTSNLNASTKNLDQILKLKNDFLIIRRYNIINRPSLIYLFFLDIFQTKNSSYHCLTPIPYDGQPFRSMAGNDYAKLV